MLILTRRSGEALNIGGDVEITVLEVSGDHVRLGIQAPRQVQVLRKELREEVERENRLAAGVQGKLPFRPTGGLHVRSAES
jgi:carbon storage regulator